MKVGSARQPRAAAVCWVKRPSLGPTATDATRRFRPFAEARCDWQVQSKAAIHRRREIGRTTKRGNPLVERDRSASPSGLAQTVEHMGVVFRAVPRYTTADKHIEGGRCHTDGLFQHLPRFLGAT